MSDSKTTAMLATFTDLRRSERAQNADIQSRATLIATMIETHDQAQLQFGEGQAALEHAARSLLVAIEARGHTVAAHADLARVARRHRFDWSMAGDGGATLPEEEERRRNRGIESGVPIAA